MADHLDASHLAVDIATAWNRGDAGALAALFAEDADFVNVVGLWWNRRRAIEKAHAYGFERIFSDAKMTVETVKTRQLRPDVHIVHMKWRMDGQNMPDGTPAGSRNGIMSLVAQRDRDGFRIVSAQNTDIVEGVDTHIAGAAGRTTASYSNASARI